MATTKKILSEQILFKIGGGAPEAASPIDERDIWKAIEQKVNAGLKLEHFSVTLAAGETIPDQLRLAHYDGVAVTSSGDRAKLTLPIMPISLPRNMGVYMIEDSEGMTNFIPIQLGQRILLKSQPLISDLLGQVGYEVRGREILFTKDITLYDMPTVNLTLMVFDMSQYSVTDVLPITSDMEADIVKELVAEFSQTQPDDGVVNNFSVAKPGGK